MIASLTALLEHYLVDCWLVAQTHIHTFKERFLCGSAAGFLVWKLKYYDPFFLLYLILANMSKN